MAQKTLLTCLGTCALFAIYVAAQGSIDVVVVGNLSRTQHRVSGNVSKLTNIFNFAIKMAIHIRGHPLKYVPKISVRKILGSLSPSPFQYHSSAI